MTILLAAAVALAVSYFSSSNTIIKETLRETLLGATPGTTISGNALTVGGLTRYSVSDSLRTASSTICTLRAPAATSTLVSARVMLANGLPEAGGGSYHIYKTGGSIATRTDGLLWSEAIRDQMTGFGFMATGTNETSLQNMTFASTTYLVFTADLNFNGSGRCEAIWESSYL